VNGIIPVFLSFQPSSAALIHTLKLFGFQSLTGLTRKPSWC